MSSSSADKLSENNNKKASQMSDDDRLLRGVVFTVATHGDALINKQPDSVLVTGAAATHHHSTDHTNNFDQSNLDNSATTTHEDNESTVQNNESTHEDNESTVQNYNGLDNNNNLAATLDNEYYPEETTLFHQKGAGLLYPASSSITYPANYISPTSIRNNEYLSSSNDLPSSSFELMEGFPEDFVKNMIVHYSVLQKRYINNLAIFEIVTYKRGFR